MKIAKTSFLVLRERDSPSDKLSSVSPHLKVLLLSWRYFSREGKVSVAKPLKLCTSPDSDQHLISPYNTTALI